MKVAFVIDSLANSGTEKSLLYILPKISSKIQISIYYLHKPNSLEKDFLNAGIKTKQLTKSNSLIKNYIALKMIIKSEKPTIIVSSLYKSNILCRLATFKSTTKLVGTFVSDNYNKARMQELNFKQKFGLNFYKLIDAITSFIPIKYISNSKSIKYSNCNFLKINKNKVKVIYRGRDSELIHPWIRPKNNNNFVLCIMARLLKTKGYKELIEAIYITKKKYKNITLHIYGDGNYKNEIKELITKFDLQENIILEGNISNPYLLLNKANCFIFSSWYEGLSGALIEAAISGIPIITSNIIMNKEVVNNLQNTIFHKVKDKNSIAICIEEMIKNYEKYASYSTLARQKSIEKFDINIIAKQFETFLKSIVE